MFSYIKGKVLNSSNKNVTILTNNIGWLINVPFATSYKLDQEVELYLHMQVREDDISLWGFKSQDELNIFKLLLTVSGVGPRIAITLLEEKGIQEIVYSILENNFENLKVTGVGPKTAQKIVIELKNKIAELPFKSKEKMKDSTKSNLNKGIMNEAMEGLVSLGYRESDIDKALNSLDKNITINSSQELIKILLTKL